MGGQVFRRCTTCGRRVDRTEHPTRCSGRQSKWAFRADLGVDHEGRRVQKRGGGYRTRQDAERALREVLVRVDRATYVEPSTRTVEQYLLTEWLPTQAPPRVSPNRYRNERNAVQRHLVPYLGRLRLQELNANHLDRFYADLLQGVALGADAEPRCPLAPATVVQIHGVIRKALRDAVKWGHLERNVATLAEPRSNASVRADRRRAIQVWNPEQLAQFLAATREHWLYAMWLLAVTTGLRRGELAGTVDGALDLDVARLVVDWQLVPEERADEPGRTRPVHKRFMESSGSSRTIDLDRFTVAELRRWLATRAEWQQAVGPGWRGAAELPRLHRGPRGTRARLLLVHLARWATSQPGLDQPRVLTSVRRGPRTGDQGP